MFRYHILNLLANIDPLFLKQSICTLAEFVSIRHYGAKDSNLAEGAPAPSPNAHNYMCAPSRILHGNGVPQPLNCIRMYRQSLVLFLYLRNMIPIHAIR